MEGNTPVPGTVHLVDVEGILNAKHASGSSKDIVLIPTPSDDPEDPLNWSRKRKLLSTASICVFVSSIQLVLGALTNAISYTFAVGIASAAIYSVLEPIAEETGLTLNDLNAGTGYMVEDVPNAVAAALNIHSSYCLDGDACFGSP
ncbi:hypothetical protein MMC17_000605 [Xylographa soralifera]|nr:hypothetical protein [Xylographa soralifera]